MSAESINKFCEETGFQLKIMEAGFGRPAIGIMNMETECWVGYDECDAAQKHRPEDAYHKGDYICVLVHDNDYNKAIPQLEAWVAGILEGGYSIGKKRETNSISALVSGGSIMQKVLLNKAIV